MELKPAGSQKQEGASNALPLARDTVFLCKTRESDYYQSLKLLTAFKMYKLSKYRERANEKICL
jgi:hypothetical protein